MINQVTGGPIAGATVTLRPTIAGLTPRTAVTDNTGHFEITDIIPGPYRVSGDKRGFVKQDLAPNGHLISERFSRLPPNEYCPCHSLQKES